jgi:hypothetical protein
MGMGFRFTGCGFVASTGFVSTGFDTTGGAGASVGIASIGFGGESGGHSFAIGSATGFASTAGDERAGSSLSSRTSKTDRQIGFGQRIRLPRMPASN